MNINEKQVRELLVGMQGTWSIITIPSAFIADLAQSWLAMREALQRIRAKAERDTSQIRKGPEPTMFHLADYVIQVVDSALGREQEAI